MDPANQRSLALFFNLKLINTFPVMAVPMGTAVMAGLPHVVILRYALSELAKTHPAEVSLSKTLSTLPTTGMLISD